MLFGVVARWQVGLRIQRCPSSQARRFLSPALPAASAAPWRWPWRRPVPRSPSPTVTRARRRSRRSKSCGAFGVDAYAIECELSEVESIHRAVEAAAGALGGLSMVVNNAGAFETVPLESMSAEAWDAIFATNTRAPFLVTQAALPYLRGACGGGNRRPGDQHRLAGRPASLGYPCTLLRVQGRPAHAHTDHGQGLCAGGGGQLRCPWNDCHRRGRARVRALYRQNADGAQWRAGRCGRGCAVLRERHAVHHRADSYCGWVAWGFRAGGLLRRLGGWGVLAVQRPNSRASKLRFPGTVDLSGSGKWVAWGWGPSSSP